MGAYVLPAPASILDFQTLTRTLSDVGTLTDTTTGGDFYGAISSIRP
jgi:hypothetical protein